MTMKKIDSENFIWPDYLVRHLQIKSESARNRCVTIELYHIPILVCRVYFGTLYEKVTFCKPLPRLRFSHEKLHPSFNGL